MSFEFSIRQLKAIMQIYDDWYQGVKMPKYTKREYEELKRAIGVLEESEGDSD